MKTWICILILLISVENLQSQTEVSKGDLTAGISGVPLFYNNTDGKLSVSGFALKGSFGVFLNKNLSLENNLFYYKDDDVYNDESPVHSTSYGIQISLRYHYSIGTIIKIYADAGAGLGSIEYSDDYNNPYWSYDQFNSGIAIYTFSLGALIRIINNMDVEFAIPYLAVFNTTNSENIYGNERGKLLYGAMAGPTFGLRYWF